MKFKLILLFCIIVSCTTNYNNSYNKTPYNSKGFAYIFNQTDYDNKIIKTKLNDELFEISHNKLRSGSLIKIINPKTKDEIILKNKARSNYPDFYKILITSTVAEKLNIDKNMPFVEIIELKKNKSFIAKKTKIFNEEKKIHSKAPVALVKIDNISKNKKVSSKNKARKMYIIIGDFYQKESALNLKKRISKELLSYDSKKLLIKTKKSSKTTLISGPYSSINLMKNDYIQLKNFGFEELDISINE